MTPASTTWRPVTTPLNAWECGLSASTSLGASVSRSSSSTSPTPSERRSLLTARAVGSDEVPEHHHEVARLAGAVDGEGHAGAGRIGAQALAEGGQRQVGRRLVVHRQDEVALAQAGLGGGAAGVGVDDLEGPAS